MSRTAWLRGALVVALAPFLLFTASAMAPVDRPAPKVTPKFEAVAETGLLMNGLNQSNYRGLEKLLKQKPGDADTWSFVRGQSLLIAETGNLLLLRPPRSGGQDAWMADAMELREKAADLARRAGDRDYDGCKTGLLDVAGVCNKCHQTFRVPTRIGPDAPERAGVRDAD